MSDEKTPTQPQSTSEELIAVRREKLAKLKELGLDPYGAAFETTTTPGELKTNFNDDQPVKLGGRLLAIRDMGKSVFATLGDAHGRIQIYLNKKGVSETDWEAYQCLDLGDWIGVEGETFTTGKGEPSVKVEQLTILSKALRPMPDKWHGLSDRETKYRKRHLDLMSNQESADLFIMRSKIVAEIRNFLHERDYLEVETPMLHDVAGGAAAKPFETHHNALSMPLTMRIAPELHLKRLLVGGLTKVFELNRNFRNEGISRRHNPEFTMLEAYQAFGDFEIMADLVEEMVCHLAQKFFGTLQIEH
ncbi:MAG: OB-fold nucleic acid binding domain-containing protein, partial [Akkermansiaceae bacterium]|nr:OB-fold nucleic acid binding domain-containing protein [Akkermansiaceae bacterium]